MAWRDEPFLRVQDINMPLLTHCRAQGFMDESWFCNRVEAVGAKREFGEPFGEAGAAPATVSGELVSILRH